MDAIRRMGALWRKARKPPKTLDWNAFGDTEEKLQAIEAHRKRSEKARFVVRAGRPTKKARKG